MSPRRFRPSGTMLVALLALVMATTGSAVAASLITSKQIKDGTIQTKDISKKAKKALKGNRGLTGPTGATGLQGPKGDKGDTGATGTAGAKGDKGDAGPSHSYADIASNPPFLQFNATASNDTTVASVTVPAGTYIIDATVLANNNLAARHTLTCRLEGPSGTLLNETNEVVFLDANPTDDRNWFNNAAATTFSDTTTISEICQTSSNSGVYSAHSLIATAVGALN